MLTNNIFYYLVHAKGRPHLCMSISWKGKWPASKEGRAEASFAAHIEVAMAEGMPYQEAHADEIALTAYEARAGKQALVTQTTATNEPTSEYDVPRYIGNPEERPNSSHNNLQAQLFGMTTRSDGGCVDPEYWKTRRYHHQRNPKGYDHDHWQKVPIIVYYVPDSLDGLYALGCRAVAYTSLFEPPCPPLLLGTYLADPATSQSSHTITKDLAVCRCRNSHRHEIFALRLYVKIYRTTLDAYFYHSSKR